MEGATLLDFGIARSAGSTRGAGPTLTGMLVGTPGYMAPEQVRGRSMLSPSVDVFALGCVLYECLTGRPPFRGDYLETVLVRILFEAPPSLRSLRPELPAALESLLDRMLCKDPAQRIADAGALLQALNQLADQLAADASTTDALTESRPIPRLGVKEQQLVSVLVGRLAPVSGHGETLAVPEQQQQLTGELDSLRQGLAALGVRSELLVDGTFVATITSQESAAATDQANRAAHCALLLRQHFPAAAVALATGRAVLDGQLPLGEAISRAVQLSHAPPPPAALGAGPPILMDTVTSGLLDSRFETIALDPDAVVLLGEPGKNESRRLLGKLTACVGRERELELLDATLDACISESAPTALLILAPAGLGKSRLRLAFERRVSLHRSEVQLLLGRGDLMGTGAPFSLLRQAILTLCAIQAGDSLESRRAKLRQRISSVVPAPSLERTVVFLGELCGVPFADGPSSMLREARQQPQVMQQAIRHAFLTWLRAQCAAQPVVLVLEDLQWADLATVQLVDAALRELDGAPLFLLGLARPEGPALFPKLWPETAPSLQLRPLNRRAREQLIRQVLDKQTSAEVVTRLALQSEGNALYLEELIRAEVEGKGDAPPTVLAMLQARIGRLEAAARRALRAASVFGESCWSGGVGALLGVDESEALRWLHYLTRQEVLEQKAESRFLHTTEFFFRHALMRDAAYDLLPPEDRVLAHALAGRFLEHSGERAAVLAHHFHQGKELLAAARYYEQAGDEAAAISVLDQARRCYAAALEDVQDAAPGPQQQRQQADLLVKQVTAGLMIEPAAAQLQRLGEAQARLAGLAAQVAGGAPADEDSLRMARLHYLHGRVLYYDNQPIAALRYHQKVLPVVARLGDSNLRILNTFAIGRAYVLTGRFGLAQQLLSEVIEPMAELGDRSEWSRCFCFYAMALSGTGRYDESLRQLERGLDVALKSEQQPVLAMFQLTRAGAHLQAADWPRVVEAAQSAMELAAPFADKTVAYMALDTLAWAESYLGQPEQALAHRARARELRQSVGGGICRDWYEAGDAEILLHAGRPEAALQQAQSVIAALDRDEFPFAHAIAERAWGCALARLHRDPAEVSAHFQTALAICRAHEQVVNEALTEVWWGRVLSEAHPTGNDDGNDDAAARHIQTGITLLERAGCTHAAAAARQHAVTSPKMARQHAFSTLPGGT